MKLETKKLQPKVVAALETIRDSAVNQPTAKQYTKTVSKLFNISRQESKLIVDEWLSQGE